MKKAVCSLPTLLCAALIVLTAIPGRRPPEECRMFVLTILLMEGIWIYHCVKKEKPTAAHDIISLLYGVMIFWELMTAKLDLAHPVLIPTPEAVFQVFYTQRKLMIRGVVSSLELLALGLALGLVLGMGLGMLAGWIPRVREMLFPIARVISPIPPIIYTPYIVALMPTFRSASVVVVVLGIFWPTFMNTILRVTGMEEKLLESARALCPNTKTMIVHILFPYVWPGVIRNLRVMLSTSFLILTMAEMMGASSGMGYFIKNYSDYANYTNVIAGIILVGIVVTVLNQGIGYLEKKLIKWRN